MKQSKSTKNFRILIVFLLTVFQLSGFSQITVYQYRHVPDDKINEFVKRETTYWSKVAEKAVKDKSMTFWALLEKVGGYDLPNSSNYLFINTFPDVDKTGDVFGVCLLQFCAQRGRAGHVRRARIGVLAINNEAYQAGIQLGNPLHGLGVGEPFRATIKDGNSMAPGPAALGQKQRPGRWLDG